MSEATIGAGGASSFSARARSCAARQRSRSKAFSHSKWKSPFLRWICGALRGPSSPPRSRGCRCRTSGRGRLRAVVPARIRIAAASVSLSGAGWPSRGSRACAATCRTCRSSACSGPCDVRHDDDLRLVGVDAAARAAVPSKTSRIASRTCVMTCFGAHAAAGSAPTTSTRKPWRASNSSGQWMRRACERSIGGVLRRDFLDHAQDAARGRAASGAARRRARRWPRTRRRESAGARSVARRAPPAHASARAWFPRGRWRSGALGCRLYHRAAAPLAPCPTRGPRTAAGPRPRTRLIANAAVRPSRTPASPAMRARLAGGQFERRA